MNTLDAGFYYVEHDNVPMHIGLVAVFEGPAPSPAELTGLFEAKLPLVPRYRQVVRTTPLNIFRPMWIDDEHFEVTYHLRHVAVPAPGGDEELRALAARLLAQRLDRSRPLWEEWFAEGLKNGRWAIISKVHHCMVDGMGGTDLMGLVFDTERDAKRQAPASWQARPAPAVASLVLGGSADLVTWPVRQLAALPGLLKRSGVLGNLLDYGRGLSHSARQLAEPSATFLNGPIGPHRRWAWTTASLAELKQIRKANGGTVNDVMLAAITSAFRHLLIQRAKLTQGLVVRTLVPVSVRSQNEHAAVTNRLTAVLVNLPVSEPDPVRRLALIREQTDSLKHTHQAVSAEILTSMLGFTAPTWLALGLRAAFTAPQPLIQALATNIPGPRSPLYILGRQMKAAYPYAPIASSTRISIAIFSYLDTVTFGVTADYTSVPDVDVLIRGIGRGLAELHGLAGRQDQPAPPHKQPARPQRQATATRQPSKPKPRQPAPTTARARHGNTPGGRADRSG
jgi:WS/DGAT/MGAT family acyltransferase